MHSQRSITSFATRLYGRLPAQEQPHPLRYNPCPRYQQPLVVYSANYVEDALFEVPTEPFEGPGLKLLLDKSDESKFSETVDNSVKKGKVSRLPALILDLAHAMGRRFLNMTKNSDVASRYILIDIMQLVAGFFV